jgi:ABC-type glutathione transport system ATPase component
MADVMPPSTARLEQKAAARTEDAVKIYGKGQTEVRALDGVTVEFAAGRYTAVMGPSGSGKSSPPRTLRRRIRAVARSVIGAAGTSSQSGGRRFLARCGRCRL